MSEFPLTPHIVMDGLRIDGRSRRRKDGSYEWYDLGTAKQGDTLNVVNDNDQQYELVKTDSSGDVLEGWQQYEHTVVEPDDRGPKRLERSLGRTVRIVCLRPNRYGVPFRTSTHIIREMHHELGIVEVDPESEDTHTLRSLGLVARILSGPQEIPII